MSGNEQQKNSGREQIGDCVFVWIKVGDEIYGHVEYTRGGVVTGSGGFWRTADPFVAKSMAKEIFVDSQKGEEK